MVDNIILGKRVCPKCNGTRRIKEKDGTIHVCFDCLMAGELDEHDKTFKDHGIRV